jgi:FMN phosphatase YigB (HAD superfamily)
VLFVGDDFEKDVRGAKAMGMVVLLLYLYLLLFLLIKCIII